MSLYHPLTNENDSGSSDGFEKLPQNLYQNGLNYSQNFDKAERSIPPNTYDFETDFGKWQLTRYGRTSTVKIWHFITSSFYCSVKKFYYLFIFYAIMLIIAAISVKSNYWFIFIPFAAFTRLFKTGVSISLILNEKWNSRLHLLFTKSALIIYFIELVPSFFVYESCICFLRHSSAIYFLTLFLILSAYATFFLPCFVFETKPLPISALVSFSINVSLLSPQFIQILAVFFISFVFQMIGPLSLGLTDWMGQIIKPSVFFAVCGSGLQSFEPDIENQV